MGTGTIPPGLLVDPSKLSRFNVPPAFLQQFAPRPFSVTVSTAGPLGTMQFTWQFLPSDTAQSAPIQSANTSPAAWLYTIDDVFADVTFAAQYYTTNTVYTVDTLGNVTGGFGVTATRFDLRQTACSAVTTEALSKMRDAIRTPLTAWGDDVTAHAAAWAYAKLKRGRGATADGVGMGDENVFLGEKQAQQFFDDIGKNGKPDSMTDSDTSTDGPLIPVLPYGDPSRGW